MWDVYESLTSGGGFTGRDQARDRPGTAALGQQVWTISVFCQLAWYYQYF